MKGENILVRLGLCPRTGRRVGAGSDTGGNLRTRIRRSGPASSPAPSIGPMTTGGRMVGPSHRVDGRVLSAPMARTVGCLFFGGGGGGSVSRLGSVVSCIGRGVPTSFPIRRLGPTVSCCFGRCNSSCVREGGIIGTVNRFGKLLTDSLSAGTGERDGVRRLGQRVMRRRGGCGTFGRG